MLGRLWSFIFGGGDGSDETGAATGNDRLRAALAEHGDDGTQVRHVLHFAYPVTEGDGQADKQMARDAVDWLGVSFSDSADSSGIVFEHHREVASAGFDEMTARLNADLDAIGWTYDGWECAVKTRENE